MQWMELSITTPTKQQREATLKTISFPSTVPSVELPQSEDMPDGGQSHLACVQKPSQHPTASCWVPLACASHDRQYPVVPFSQQPNSFDGSLNDMLLPYQDAKLLDELLSEQVEPLQQQLAPIPQIEQSQFYNTTIAFFNGKSHDEDAKKATMVSSPPPMNPTPTLTRRPPMRKGTVLYRENHIRTERQRRQDMKSLFRRLKSVLPGMQHDHLKRDRCTILENVIDYVQELDKKVQALGKMKAKLMQGEEGVLNHHHQGLAQQAALAFADSVSVCPWGHVEIFITLKSPKNLGLWPNLLALLQDSLHLDVQNVALSSTPLFWVHSIYACKVMSNDSEEVCCKVKNTLRVFVTHHTYNNHFMH